MIQKCIGGTDKTRVAHVPAVDPPGRSRGPLHRALVEARLAAGLTQAKLAARIGTTQSAVARLERGTVNPSVQTLRRLAQVLGLTFVIGSQSGLTARLDQERGLTMHDLQGRRKQILEIAAARGAHNVRVFGSVARGEAGPESDVDFLVEFDPERTVLDLSDLILDLQEALARRVDVVEIWEPSPAAERIQSEAVPL